MSVKVSTLCWKLRLPVVDKLVLLRLADYANDDGSSIYPAVATVASYCGISERAVQYILKKFVEDGLLIVIRNENGGRGKTRHYAMDLEQISNLSADFDETVQTPQRANRVQNKCTLNDTVQSQQTLQRVNDEAEKGAELMHPTHQLPVTEKEDSYVASSDATTMKPFAIAQGTVDDRIAPTLFLLPEDADEPSDDEHFEIFWKAYPRRASGEGKAEAKELFKKVVYRGTPPEILTQCAFAYRECMIMDGCTSNDIHRRTNFVMQCSKFLNPAKRRWEEWPEVLQRKKSSGSNIHPLRPNNRYSDGHQSHGPKLRGIIG